MLVTERFPFVLPPPVTIAASPSWRSKITTAARAARIPLSDPTPDDVGIRPITCAWGDLALLVPQLDVPRAAAERPLIGAHSDSIEDLESRDAVADVAALLSLHGNIILDLDAGRSRWRRPRRPDILVSVAGNGPLWTQPSVVMPVGRTRRGRPLSVRLVADPGFEYALLDMARLVEADQCSAEAA